MTVGALHALAGLGFSPIYNASRIIDFAQGGFIMVGGMTAAPLITAGVLLPLAISVAAAATAAGGCAREKFAIEPARQASVTRVIMLTIGAAIFLCGVAKWLEIRTCTTCYHSSATRYNPDNLPATRWRRFVTPSKPG